MIDNKWYESIQHFQSPYPLTAAFCRELSILGPLLFSIYTNDLPSAPKKCSVQSYVDDTKLFVSFKMKDTLTPLLIEGTTCIEKVNGVPTTSYCWTQAKLNLWCLVADKRIPIWSLPAPLSWWEESVPEHTSKDLGVILDTNRTYDEHITKTVSSCMSCLSLISRTKHVFDKRSVLTILNALVFRKCFIVQTYGRIHKKVMYVAYKVLRTLLLELRHVRANMITIYQF